MEKQERTTEMAGGQEVRVPYSSASRNLLVSLCFLAMGVVFWVFGVSTWLSVSAFCLSFGFLVNMLICVLDVQECKMQQNQKIIELLASINHTMIVNT
jgi:Flp pilus assembly protein TadB